MILADTSAWVEFLRATGSPIHRRVHDLVADGLELRTTDVVIMELLAGAVSQDEHARIRRLLYRFDLLAVEGPGDYEAAAELYRTCRRAGETVTKMTDCLIAAVVLRTGASLLQRDADFDVLARHTALRIEPVTG